jgi:hypothetical protein
MGDKVPHIGRWFRVYTAALREILQPQKLSPVGSEIKSGVNIPLHHSNNEISSSEYMILRVK